MGMELAVVLLGLVLGSLGFAPEVALKRRPLVRPVQAARVDTLRRARRILENKLNDVKVPSVSDETGAAGGTVAGAVLGGMVLGPLGMFLGGSFGRNVGSAVAEQQRQKNRLRELGIDESTVRAAQLCVAELGDAEEALRLAEDSRESATRYLDSLERDRAAAQQAAEDAVRKGDDDAARRYLTGRMSLDERLDKARDVASGARKTVASAEDSVRFIKARSADLEELIARTIVASQAAAKNEPLEDPILARFKALED